MIPMNNWPSEAVKKMSAEKTKVAGAKAKAMAGAVFEALKSFCLQDEEFAQAVVQGGTFVDCMKSVAKGVDQHISDLEAYKKAVAFYFPGANIRMTMSIDLIGDAEAPETEPVQQAPLQIHKPEKSELVLSLEDFL